MSGVREPFSKLSFSSSSSDGTSINALSIDGRACEIRDVRASNLKEEFYQQAPGAKVQLHRNGYWFSGVVTQPVEIFRNLTDYQDKMMRFNVNFLKIIQLGIIIFDEHGNKPEHISIWKFYFKCCLSKDTFAQDSIDLLVQSDEVRWLTFHIGYDFGHLLEMLTEENLPVAETDFFETLNLYFPCVYDITYLTKSCGSLRGSLQEVSGQRQIERVGLQHQAGSDSLLTGVTFFKIRK
ncbi:hypothetical protein MRX96_034336 [Rhipicephalus microplus]